MSDRYGGVRQLPCPDCGSPVQPEREQLCPRCGYPLMFLRQNGAGDDARAQSIPRRPNEHDDPTALRAVPLPRTEPRIAPGYAPAPGQAPCRACGYPNDAVRVRCERCGYELRPARPQARVLAPPAAPAAAHRGGWGWLIVLIVLAVLALIALAATLIWRFVL